jgi:hypothetical protein
MNNHGFKTQLSPTSFQFLVLVRILFDCGEYQAIVETYGMRNPDTSHHDGNIVMKSIDLEFCKQDSNCRPSLSEWRFRNALRSTCWSDCKEEKINDSYEMGLSPLVTSRQKKSVKLFCY